MKRAIYLYLLSISIFYSLTLQAQLIVNTENGIPQKYPYSSQVRDTNGDILADQNVGLRISLHTGSDNGSVVYVQTDNTTTSPTGIFSVVVGGGNAVYGNFDSIPWGISEIYQQVEIDFAGGTNYVDMGTTQLLSFPYALAAGNGLRDAKIDDEGMIELKTADGSEDIKFETGVWTTGGIKGVGAYGGFIGTVDNSDLVLKRFNAEGLRIMADNKVTIPGYLGLGKVTNPTTSLDMSGAITIRDTTVYVASNFFLNVANHGHITIYSTVNPSAAIATLSDGTTKGQILMIYVDGPSNTKGVNFVNNASNNTRISPDGRGVNQQIGSSVSYNEGNTILLMWNGNDWVQISSSIPRP